MKKNKKFDAVGMKHKGADRIHKIIARKSTKEELVFWKEKTNLLKQQQHSHTKV